MSDLVERAKQMPSSLNDAMRSVEAMADEIERQRAEIDRWKGDAQTRDRLIVNQASEIVSLRKQLASAESTIDTLESNARVQAKLLADTGRERDELRRQLALSFTYEQYHMSCDAIRNERNRAQDEANELRKQLVQANAKAEYWRLAAERREHRRELTGLDIPEARTLDAPEVSVTDEEG